MMIVVLLGIFLSLLVPLLFPGYYLSELMISFLPYLTAFAGGLLVVSFVYTNKMLRSRHQENYRRYWGLVFLLFCVVFFLYSKQFNAFYSTDRLPRDSDTPSLTVLFANMYKNNRSYIPIQDMILKYDPDILMFVEFAPHHYEQLKDFLKTHYPYTNNINRSTTFVGSMVFSKYPIHNKAQEFPQ